MRKFPSVTPPESRHQALLHSGCVWTVLKPKCIFLHPDRERERLKKPPFCSSLDQVSLITSGRGRIAPVTAWDGQTLKSSHSQLHIIWHTEPQSHMPECHWWSLFLTGLMIFSSKSANKRWLGMAYFYCELKRSLILSLLKFLCVSLTTEEQNPKWVGNFLLKHSL